MESKTSKAQLEVWEWKEKLSKELNKIPLHEQQKYIHDKTKGIVSRLKAAKRRKPQKNT